MVQVAQKIHGGDTEMTESKKPVSAEDLRKALAEVEAIVWATCESSSLGMEKMNELLHKFSVFQADYDKQVHVSRKQLSELINKYPSYRLMSRHPTVREFTDFILLRDDHFEKLKELFEATQK